MVGATNRLRAQEEIGGESHKSRYGDTWYKWYNWYVLRLCYVSFCLTEILAFITESLEKSSVESLEEILR